MQDIKSVITDKLKEIENLEQIKILYAVESGSRGWGFESKDSDYDVRFIYAHTLDWYLSIKDKRDVIEYPVSKQLDLSGNEARIEIINKFLEEKIKYFEDYVRILPKVHIPKTDLLDFLFKEIVSPDSFGV